MRRKESARWKHDLLFSVCELRDWYNLLWRHLGHSRTSHELPYPPPPPTDGTSGYFGAMSDYFVFGSDKMITTHSRSCKSQSLIVNRYFDSETKTVKDKRVNRLKRSRCYQGRRQRRIRRPRLHQEPRAGNRTFLFFFNVPHTPYTVISGGRRSRV